MPLPAGFKVSGSTSKKETGIPVPPRAKKIMSMLDGLPTSELLTTLEMTERIACASSSHAMRHPVLREYREKVDNKLFWGSRKSIAQLRKQLDEENK